MAERRSSGGGARAKERPGTGIYRRWRSVRGSRGQPHRRCTRGVGSKAWRRAADQRPNGERRLARRRVENSHLAPSKRPRTSHTVALRRGAWTDGSSGASACARGARTAGWHGARARARSGVAGEKQFADAVLKIVFLWISKLKCTLQSIAKLKITHSSTTFAKAGRGLYQ
jgi:hypothetical protein